MPAEKTQSFCPCSRVLNRSGKGLNTLTPKQYTPFWYLVTFTEGWCKFACCLVLMWYISEFIKNLFLFLIMNKSRERIYWEVRGKISKLKNNFLHESLLLQPIIILIIFFCNLKIFMLSGEFPQNNKPGHHWVKVGVVNRFQSICCCIWFNWPHSIASWA
jgi:hypothetical protein